MQIQIKTLNETLKAALTESGATLLQHGVPTTWRRRDAQLITAVVVD